MQKICLDTGIFSIFFEDKSRDRHKVVTLFNNIKEKKIEGYVMNSVIPEIYYQLCVLKGKDYATSKLVSFLKRYPIKLVSPDLNHLILAGQIKCTDRKHLSYIDCLSIAYSLHAKMPFHTTEKQIKKIPAKTLDRLKIVNYWWD